jgi:hypothetical protein
MSLKTKTELKTLFTNGTKLTESKMHDLVDSIPDNPFSKSYSFTLSDAENTPFKIGELSSPVVIESVLTHIDERLKLPGRLNLDLGSSSINILENKRMDITNVVTPEILGETTTNNISVSFTPHDGYSDFFKKITVSGTTANSGVFNGDYYLDTYVEGTTAIYFKDGGISIFFSVNWELGKWSLAIGLAAKFEANMTEELYLPWDLTWEKTVLDPATEGDPPTLVASDMIDPTVSVILRGTKLT